MVINTSFGVFVIRENVRNSTYWPTIIKGEIYYVCNSLTFYRILLREKGLTDEILKQMIFVASEIIDELIDEITLEKTKPKYLFYSNHWRNG